uniref:Uncharacterized protein orf107a n=1 Tax=Staurastrum punctulatum TaxID=102822 RepID=Q32RR0_STAPU|nr:hypothetical protein StpuCp103 [Staurastrum punctulatum]AAX45779.1 hypothetical protein [Staurastrum punctulatum]
MVSAGLKKVHHHLPKQRYLSSTKPEFNSSLYITGRQRRRIKRGGSLGRQIKASAKMIVTSLSMTTPSVNPISLFLTTFLQESPYLNFNSSIREDSQHKESVGSDLNP